jgi:hypothetical protein
MSTADLAQDFAEVRRLLGRPKLQAPTPDDIVSELIFARQHVLNRTTNTGKGWSKNLVNVSSVVNQAEYQITPNSGASFGKALYAYRDLGSNDILPVTFTDFTSETNNQRYEFWLAPLLSGTFPSYFGEKIAFFRKGANVWLRIFPIPEEVRTYSIQYASGNLDWQTWNWDDVPEMPEYSRLRQTMAALALIRRTEWEGYSMDQNIANRTAYRNDLLAQYALIDDEFKTAIRNPNGGPNIGEVGYWYSR